MNNLTKAVVETLEGCNRDPDILRAIARIAYATVKDSTHNESGFYRDILRANLILLSKIEPDHEDIDAIYRSLYAYFTKHYTDLVNRDIVQ